MTFGGSAALAAALVGGVVSLVGCRQEWSIHKAPDGFAVVREHVIFAPRNIPPARSELDFTIITVDGAAVVRERPPPFVDLEPGALVAAGIHRFTARVAPHLLPPGYRPYEVSFMAAVEGGKIYFLVDREKMPVLVEEHLKPE